MGMDNRPLKKGNVRPGMILWLKQNAQRLDLDAFSRSKLEINGLNHPVVVISILRADHDYVWVCTMSGSCRDQRDVPLLHHPASSWQPLCHNCGTRHVFVPYESELSSALVLECSEMSMEKPTHVRLDRVFEVSLKMLSHCAEPKHISATSLEYALERAKKAMEIVERTSFALSEWPARLAPGYGSNINSRHPSTTSRTAPKGKQQHPVTKSQLHSQKREAESMPKTRSRVKQEPNPKAKPAGVSSQLATMVNASPDTDPSLEPASQLETETIAPNTPCTLRAKSPQILREHFGPDLDLPETCKETGSSHRAGFSDAKSDSKPSVSSQSNTQSTAERPTSTPKTTDAEWFYKSLHWLRSKLLPSSKANSSSPSLNFHRHISIPSSAYRQPTKDLKDLISRWRALGPHTAPLVRQLEIANQMATKLSLGEALE